MSSSSATHTAKRRRVSPALVRTSSDSPPAAAPTGESGLDAAAEIMSAAAPAARPTPVPRSEKPVIPLRDLLEAVPPETPFTAGWLLEKLSESECGVSAPVGAAERLTAEEFGSQRIPSRSADWVRQMCAAGRIEGAEKVGRDWLIPASSLSLKLRASLTDTARQARGSAPASPARASRTTYPRWNSAA